MNLAEEANKRRTLDIELSNAIREASGLWFHIWITGQAGERHRIDYDTSVRILYNNDGKPVALEQVYNGLPSGDAETELSNAGDIHRELFDIEEQNDMLLTHFVTRRGIQPMTLDKNDFTYYDTMQESRIRAPDDAVEEVPRENLKSSKKRRGGKRSGHKRRPATKRRH